MTKFIKRFILCEHVLHRYLNHVGVHVGVKILNNLVIRESLCLEKEKKISD